MKQLTKKEQKKRDVQDVGYVKGWFWSKAECAEKQVIGVQALVSGGATDEVINGALENLLMSLREIKSFSSL